MNEKRLSPEEALSTNVPADPTSTDHGLGTLMKRPKDIDVTTKPIRA